MLRAKVVNYLLTYVTFKFRAVFDIKNANQSYIGNLTPQHSQVPFLINHNIRSSSPDLFLRDLHTTSS